MLDGLEGRSLETSQHVNIVKHLRKSQNVWHLQYTSGCAVSLELIYPVILLEKVCSTGLKEKDVFTDIVSSSMGSLNTG